MPQTHPTRCALHPAFDADYCPSCGTSRRIGEQSDPEISEATAARILDEYGLLMIARAVDGDLDMHGLMTVRGSERYALILIDVVESGTFRVGLYADSGQDEAILMIDAPTVDDAVAAVRVLRLAV